MNTNKKTQWAEHHKRIDGVSPRPLAIESLQYVKEKEQVLDLGAGTLNDSEYFINEGFKKVTAIDIETSVAERKHSKNIKIVITSFEAVNLPENKYDLISAQWSLPFISPESFDGVMNKISKSLKKNGIFTGHLFGDRDDWTKNTTMTFHTIKEAKKALKEYEIIKFKEEEKDGTIADGTSKHWHLYSFIVKKK